MYSKKLSITSLLLFSIVISCTDLQKEKWQTIEGEYETVMTIGSDAGASEIYFSFPHYGDLDSNGNLIVADLGKSKLLVFDNKGNYTNSIGKRGRGPNEFRSIKGLNVNDKNEIVVFDSNSQSFKAFNANGDFIGVKESSDMIASGVGFESLEQKNVLFFTERAQSLDKAFLLHVYESGSFSNLADKAAPISSIDKLNGKHAYSNFMGQGVNHVVYDNSIYFTPLAYNGIIYEYIYSPEDKKLTLEKKHIGNTYKEPVTYLENKNLDNINVDAKFSDFDTGKEVGVIHHNWSIGLVKTSKGNFLHFTFIEKGEERIFGAELYDSEFNPKKYITLFKEEMSTEPGVSNLLSWKIIGIDDQDRIYVLDREDTPLVRVIKLDYDV